MVVETKEYTKLFQAVAKLRDKLGLGKCQDTIWDYEIGDWRFAVNGFARHQKFYPHNSMAVRIPPYSMVFWYKGKYVGWCNPKYAIIMEEYSKADGKVEFGVGDLERVITEETNRQ
jgi:hypothetical protein